MTKGCAAELRRDRKRGRVQTPPTRVVINHRVCEGCGDCAAVSNCLSVQPIDTPFGRKTTIDQHSCNLDLSCLEGDCPAFVSITRKPSRPWRRQRPDSPTVAIATIPAVPNDLPDPAPRAAEDVSVHITGIGGTGVVTVSQMIGTAAMLEGADVQGLDQIGLSQKAGPVVSDVRITHHERAGSNRVGAGQAGLAARFRSARRVVVEWAGGHQSDPHIGGRLTQPHPSGGKDGASRDRDAHVAGTAGADRRHHPTRRSTLGGRVRSNVDPGGRLGGRQHLRGGYGGPIRAPSHWTGGNRGGHSAQRCGDRTQHRGVSVGSVASGRPGNGCRGDRHAGSTSGVRGPARRPRRTGRSARGRLRRPRADDPPPHPRSHRLPWSQAGRHLPQRPPAAGHGGNRPRPGAECRIPCGGRLRPPTSCSPTKTSTRWPA